MPLIKSISGLRGTLGEEPGENLTLADVKKFTCAFLKLLEEKAWGNKIVVGRDSRPSGLKFRDIILETAAAAGFDGLDLGLAATPTVEMAVRGEKAAGGVIISASHNPAEWNALKLLNNEGEFLSEEDGQRLLVLAESQETALVERNGIRSGRISAAKDYGRKHIAAVLKAPLVKTEAIKKAGFKVVVDGINSVGGVVIPELLLALGVPAENIIRLNCAPTGDFAHNPEPLEKNLIALAEMVRSEKADFGLAVDPDVDRLAFIDETGAMFGEEYTLVAAADYVLKNFALVDAFYPGRFALAAASNLSSSRALKDVCSKRGAAYSSAAVGEVNVVKEMKKTQAVIGGEGNGGVIYPPLHYGRDALIGTALFLSALAEAGEKLSLFKKNFPAYFMVKDKLALTPGLDLAALLDTLANDYRQAQLTRRDGLKIDWPDAWLHVRGSNTEPIVRLYAEAANPEEAREKIEAVKAKILSYIS